MMQQQMLFARPSSSSAWQQNSPSAISDDTRLQQRVVTFAVQDVQPSPVVYRNRTPRVQEQSPYAVDLTEEVSPMQQRPRSQQRNQRTEKTTAIRARPRTRRPGWDDDVNHNSTLFDTSLKKSVLFQPRAGMRREEEQVERKHIARTTRSQRKKTPSAQMTPVRYRSGPSSVYTQQRNVTPWPQRRAKDFVRQNIEHMTGRPVVGQFNRREERPGSRENVFERLSAQRVSKGLLRMVPPPASSEPDPLPARVSPLSPPTPDSPVLLIDPPTPDKQNSIGSATPSPEIPRKGLGLASPYSSPQRSQRSFSSRNSPAIRSTSTNRSGPRSRAQRYDNYPARVFGVLDRDNERRIGVSQILQGLRLLGLPATHNQISDYVYLIHEGRHNSIDLEEWEILVGTLDAVSRPSSHSPRNPHAGQGSAIPSQSPSMRSISDHSPYNFMPPSRSPPSRSDHPTPTRVQTPGTSTRRNHIESRDEGEFFSMPVERKAAVSAEYQPIPEDDPYLEEIQNRIEVMFEKAQATAALRWAPGLGNNQIENDPNHSNSDKMLSRAASVVYNLRASLFPLVHQAEATLREIQQRHGSKLSLFLPPQDMAAIAQNSDVLASAILDDILLDTLQLLNEEDQQQSRRQLEVHHADQLDDILTRIHEIEREEDSMIHQGLALSYNTSGAQCGLPTATATHLEMSAQPPHQKRVNLSNVRLPLEVVLNVKIDDNDADTPQSQVSPGRSVIEAAKLNESFDFDSEIPTQQTLLADGSVKTSILQGKRLQSIERSRHKFQHHRRLVESSLAETGMTQYAVIEILEEMLLDDLVEETAAELNDTVLSMSDTLLTNLV